MDKILIPIFFVAMLVFYILLGTVRLILRALFFALYPLVWRIIRPLFWKGGAPVAHERSLRILAYCDDHAWTWPILKLIHWITF